MHTLHLRNMWLGQLQLQGLVQGLKFSERVEEPVALAPGVGLLRHSLAHQPAELQLIISDSLARGVAWQLLDTTGAQRAESGLPMGHSRVSS